MSPFSLPPELLLAVFLFAIDEENKYSGHYLAALGLVHSSWRSVAQAHLPRQVDLPGVGCNGQGIRAALAREPFRRFKTVHLALRGSLEALLEGNDAGRWIAVETLKYTPSSR